LTSYSNPFEQDWAGSRANYRQYLIALRPVLHDLLYSKEDASGPHPPFGVFPAEVWTNIACCGALGDENADKRSSTEVVTLMDLIFAGSDAGRRRLSKLRPWHRQRLQLVARLAVCAKLIATLSTLSRCFFKWYLFNAKSFLLLFLRDLGCLNRRLSTHDKGMLRTFLPKKKDWRDILSKRKPGVTIGQLEMEEYDKENGTVDGIPTLSVVLPFGTLKGIPQARLLKSLHSIARRAQSGEAERTLDELCATAPLSLATVVQGPMATILRATACMHLYGGTRPCNGPSHLATTHGQPLELGGSLWRRAGLLHYRRMHNHLCGRDPGYVSTGNLEWVTSRNEIARDAKPGDDISALFWQASERERLQVIDDTLRPAESASQQLVQQHANLTLRLLLEMVGKYRFCALCDVALRPDKWFRMFTNNHRVVHQQRLLMPPTGFSWNLKEPPEAVPCCAAHAVDAWNAGRPLHEYPMVPYQPSMVDNALSTPTFPMVRVFGSRPEKDDFCWTEAYMPSCVCGSDTLPSRGNMYPWYKLLYVPRWAVQRYENYMQLQSAAGIYARLVANDLHRDKMLEDVREKYHRDRLRMETTLRQLYGLPAPDDDVKAKLLQSPLAYLGGMNVPNLKNQLASESFPFEHYESLCAAYKKDPVANPVTKIIDIVSDALVKKKADAEAAADVKNMKKRKRKTSTKLFRGETLEQSTKRAKLLELHARGEGNEPPAEDFSVPNNVSFQLQASRLKECFKGLEDGAAVAPENGMELQQLQVEDEEEQEERG
jgi:hypothetical protein